MSTKPNSINPTILANRWPEPVFPSTLTLIDLGSQSPFP